MNRLLPALILPGMLVCSAPLQVSGQSAASSAKTQQPAPSLADLARKEPERRKAAGSSEKPAPKKVYTNSDLKPAPPPSGETRPAAAAPADAAKAEEPKDQAHKPADEKGEEYWRGRITQAREELRRNEVFREALQSRINALATDFAARDDPYQRAQIADDRQKALAEMSRVTAEIEKTKSQIAAIEEEARQAGVPPGWIR